MVTIAADRDARLELTADNAEVEAVTPEAVDPLEVGPSSLLLEWQDNVVGIWTPTRRASGFLINRNGLIVTNQRVIGSDASVEVQLAPTVKVGASVLAADAARDVAVLWDRSEPRRVNGGRVPLECAQVAERKVVAGQEVHAIGSPLRQQKDTAFGRVTRVEAGGIESDLLLSSGSAGGPVFTAVGDFVGITAADDSGQRSRGSRIVRTDSVCVVLASAEQKMKDAAPPNGTRLPVEPLRPFPLDSLKAAAEGRAGSLNPYQVSSANFDIAFITPVLIYGTQYVAERMRATGRTTGARSPGAGLTLVRPVMDFGNWSEYLRRRSARPADSRDAETGRGFLDEGRPRRGAGAGYVSAPVQALQWELLAHARLLRRRRGRSRSIRSSSSNPFPKQTPSTRVCTSSTRERWDHSARASSSCSMRKKTRRKRRRGSWTRRWSARSGRTSHCIER